MMGLGGRDSTVRNLVVFARERPLVAAGTVGVGAIVAMAFGNIVMGLALSVAWWFVKKVVVVGVVVGLPTALVLYAVRRYKMSRSL